MLIESGPNAERKVRSFLLFVLVAIFAFWYGYDGWAGYPRKNRDEFLKTLPADQRQASDSLKVYEAVNEENVLRLEKLKIHIEDNPENAIGAILGGPPSFKTADAWYWVGPAHVVSFNVRDGRPTGEVKPVRLAHSTTDIRWQKNYGYGLGVLALLALVYVVRARMARARLDDAGLTLGSGMTISWDSMKSLDTTHFRKKGWVDLYHGEPEEPTRIDEYHYARFDEIIDAICSRKGFENPLTRPTEEESDPQAESNTTAADQREA